MYQGPRSGQQPFARRLGTIEVAAPHLLRPMYAQANMGHPSGEVGFVVGSTSAPWDEALIRLLAGAGAELLRLPDEQRHRASPDRTSRCDRGRE
jgi:hypothetical protein